MQTWIGNDWSWLVHEEGSTKGRTNLSSWFFVYINLLLELQINSVMDTFCSSLYIYFK
ncbi:hypothetical protein Hanom_Chr05g00443021 [Helianthus anomalus]